MPRWTASSTICASAPRSPTARCGSYREPPLATGTDATHVRHLRSGLLRSAFGSLGNRLDLIEVGHDGAARGACGRGHRRQSAMSRRMSDHKRLNDLFINNAKRPFRVLAYDMCVIMAHLMQSSGSIILRPVCCSPIRRRSKIHHPAQGTRAFARHEAPHRQRTIAR